VRVVAGSARGRRLAAPEGDGTRPTSDKVRAAVFNVLGQFFEGGRVLDLYAGTGAMALEALSRGFEEATCVDSSPAAAAVIARNAETCGFAGRVTVVRRRVADALPGLAPDSFDLAFVDPPYAEGPAEAMAALDRVLRQGATVVAEHARRSPPPDRVGALVVQDRRSYGDTGVSIYRRE
jgi:16S rRNA (guanine(966)-N(2))-methyltransferase RsmD